MKLIRSVRKTGFTIAPEAGSQRLRDVINKNITEEDVVDTVKDAFEQGWRVIKLYFMIGLPRETDEDIEGVVQLVKNIQQILTKNKKLKSLTVSVNTFIPKPFTPFQWSPMATENEIRRKRKYLEREFKKIPGVQFIRKNVNDEILQAIFSLGDQKVAKAIYFKITNNVDWQTAWQQTKINVDSIIHQHKNFEDKLPWDFIAYGISKERLWKAGGLGN